MSRTGRKQALPRQPVEPWEDAERIDLRDKVTGRAVYIDDLPDPPGTVHAVPLHSIHSHARIVSIDSSRAQALPGVLGVLDRNNLDGLNPHVRVGEYAGRTGEFGLTAHQHFLTVDKARFDGDLVAMVAATDRRTAQRAAELIEIDYEPLPALFTVNEALAPGAPLIHEDLPGNVACEDSFEWGEVDEALAKADRVIEMTFDTANAYHHPMEPVGSCLAIWSPDDVVLWLPTNKPFNPMVQVAELFGIDRATVRVRVPEIGGAFGAKQQHPVTMGAIALSRRLGRPVRVMATEEQSFRSTARHAASWTGRVGVRHDGTLVGLDVRILADTGAYFTGARLVTRNMCISSWGCYRLPSFRVRATTAYTNKVPAASFRATGKTQTTFAIECLMDHAAREVGLSPLAFRERNVLKRGEYVADAWLVKGHEYEADTPPMDMDFDDMMKKVTTAIGWDGKPASPRPPGATKVRGRGMALSLRHGAQGGGRAYAMASIDGHGQVRISHAAPDLGEGAFNMIAVVAAHAMGIPVERVTVEWPDTAHGLNFEGSSAQRTTVHMGNAVKNACDALKREIVDAAIQLRGGTPDDWRCEVGRVWLGDASWAYEEVIGGFTTAPSFEGHVELKGLGSYSYAPSEDKAFGGLDHWAPGAATAEVEVDVATGEITLTKVAVVADTGKVLHFGSARGQVEGGAVMGIGLALNEELVYSDGALQNGDALQYRLPMMRDIPEDFTTDLIENGDGPGPFGSKGMAQTSIPCLTPAINNAIRDAIGVHLMSAPLTPEKVLRALGKLPGNG